MRSMMRKMVMMIKEAVRRRKRDKGCWGSLKRHFPA
jgi:hypothetical protein